MAKPDRYFKDNDNDDYVMDGHYAGSLPQSLLKETRGWVQLALFSLGIAGLMAILLAVLRLPRVDLILPFNSQQLFEKGLIAHVTFAFVIWYIAIHGALTVVATRKQLPLGPLYSYAGMIALTLARISFILLLIPVALNLGEPSPNNYIPVIIHPVFFLGLATLALGLSILILRLLFSVFFEKVCEASKFGILCAGVIFFIALICLAISWFTMPEITDSNEVAEQAFWGMGHIMQFTNSLLMIVGFQIISRTALGYTPLSSTLFKCIAATFVIGAAFGPLIYVTFPLHDANQFNAFTAMYWFVMPVPLGFFFLALIILFFGKAMNLFKSNAEVVGLWMAIVLFVFGGVLGFFEGTVDTRTPAHYHAELIGVTLVFMCLIFSLFLPIINAGIPSSRWRIVSYTFLGVGQMIHSGGLYWAGLEGVARKVSTSQQVLDSSNEIFSMALMGVGGLMAVIGGVIFIFISFRCLFKNNEVAG